MGVGSSRGGVVRASPAAVNAHQPPKRGERRDAILGQCYEDIEDGIDMGRNGRVGVELDVGQKLGPGASKLSPSRAEVPNLTMRLFCAQTKDVATSTCIFAIGKSRW